MYELPELRTVRDAVRDNFPPYARGKYAGSEASICADHLRAIVFALADGASPGHGGRRYVLRKLIRRLLVRLNPPRLDHESGFKAAVESVAAANRHIVELSRDQIEQTVSTLERERALFEESGADPANYMKGPYRT